GGRPVAVVGFPGLGWALIASGVRTTAASRTFSATFFIVFLLEHTCREYPAGASRRRARLCGAAGEPGLENGRSARDRSRDDVVDHGAALRAGQAHVEPLILHRELRGIDAEQIQHRGVEVVDADRVLDRRVA